MMTLSAVYVKHTLPRGKYQSKNYAVSLLANHFGSNGIMAPGSRSKVGVTKIPIVVNNQKLVLRSTEGNNVCKPIVISSTPAPFVRNPRITKLNATETKTDQIINQVKINQDKINKNRNQHPNPSPNQLPIPIMVEELAIQLQGYDEDSQDFLLRVFSLGFRLNCLQESTAG